MSLDHERLINPVKRPDGSIVAQCPACAKAGLDHLGRNHLIIFPNGGFGCVIHPRVRGGSDKPRREHLREIRSLLSKGGKAPKGPGRKPIYGRVPPRQ